MTALGRVGFPAIRYRTGDIVESASASAAPPATPGCWLPGGILGRSDDMVVIRGMNVFPSAIEQILREFGGVGEFRDHLLQRPARDGRGEGRGGADAGPRDARAIQARLRQRLGLRVRIVPLKPGILPT